MLHVAYYGVALSCSPGSRAHAGWPGFAVLPPEHQEEARPGGEPTGAGLYRPMAGPVLAPHCHLPPDWVAVECGLRSAPAAAVLYVCCLLGSALAEAVLYVHCLF